MHNKVQIAVILINTYEPQILCLKTNIQSGSFWQNITGSVEKEESFLTAAKREVFEETNIATGKYVELPLQFTFVDRHKKNVLEKTYLLILKEKLNIVISQEHTEYIWLKKSNLTKDVYKYSTNYKTTILALKNLKGHCD